MNWLFFTLFAATGFGAVSVIAKKIMQDTSATIYTALYSFLALIFYTPIFFYYTARLDVEPTNIALLGLGVSMIGNVAAFVVYNYSVKNGELSRVVPMTRLTPIFATGIAAVVIGETIDLTLGLGVVFATAGAVIVLKEDEASYLKSLENGLHRKAVKAAILSALLYGMTSVADRVATQIIAPEIYNYFLYIGMTSGLMAMAYYRYSNPVTELSSTFNEFRSLYVLTGVVAALSSLAIFKAFSLAPAAKVTSVQQFQVLIPVVAGLVLFDEKGFKRKIIGTLVLITGIILTAL